jgi:hypothetical protein
MNDWISFLLFIPFSRFPGAGYMLMIPCTMAFCDHAVSDVWGCVLNERCCETNILCISNIFGDTPWVVVEVGRRSLSSEPL